MKTRHSERFENDPTPSRSLIEKYREAVGQDDDDDSLALVSYRGGREEYEIGLEYCLSSDPLDRATGADVLSQLGWQDQTFLEETVDVLIPMLKDPDHCVASCAAINPSDLASVSLLCPRPDCAPEWHNHPYLRPSY